MNYYDMDDYYENLSESENDKHCELEEEVMSHRSRISLEDALKYDREFVNKLLNKDQLSKVEKHWIASMHNRACEEYLEMNRTSKSFDDFVHERLGDKKYQKLVSEWLQMQGNEFFHRAGMDKELKPGAVYFMNMEEEE